MDPVDIFLIALLIAGVWAIAEFAITLRKTRDTLNSVSDSVDDLNHAVGQLVDQTTPVISKIDGMVDDLQPTVRELGPMAENLNVVIDEATVSLDKVNHILGDVSSATSGVAGVGESAGRIVSTATSAAVGVVSKVASLGGINIPEGQQLIAKKGVSGEGAPAPAAQAQEAEAPVEEPEEHKSGYVTYAPVSAPQDEE
ncbi:MAG: DUF948 domain-containing protein [Atopobiaceae bacterium]|nr:DUF948 domain-containing protein [Atopobiaceae bacterium]